MTEYRLEILISWVGSNRDFEMIPITKWEYINQLMMCEEYVECIKDGEPWGIKNDQEDTWSVILDDGRKFEVWHTSNTREAVPNTHLFRFNIGSKVFAIPLESTPVVEFLCKNFPELWSYNQ